MRAPRFKYKDFYHNITCYVKKIRTQKIIKLLTKSLCVHSKEFLLVIKIVPHHMPRFILVNYNTVIRVS